ncbi:MAG: corrinoid protein [Anaerolineales bacterium]|nr:corrinoid protein [Anaerolineales bacterium]
MSDVLEKISKAVIEGDEDMIAVLTKSALGEGLRVKEILDGGLMPGMDHVGAEFKAGRMFVPEVLLSARTMKGSMAVLEPLLAEGESIAVGKAIMGTVEGDLHDIGKNLVAMMMEGAGFQVIDLGVDVTPGAFVESVKKEKPDIVGISALLTTTMRNMGRTIDALKEAGLRDQVKVMVGGAPVTADFAKQIEADGTASSAPAAVDLAKKLVGLA